LLNKLDELDKKEEQTLLGQDELNLQHVLHDRLSELLREEEQNGTSEQR
jgi:hypothetical protein